LALEDGHNDKGEAPSYHESDSSPEQALDRSRGKDANVEKDKSKLQESELSEVQRGHNIEEAKHFRDLFRL
jgi:hypothetical protein